MKRQFEKVLNDFQPGLLQSLSALNVDDSDKEMQVIFYSDFNLWVLYLLVNRTIPKEGSQHKINYAEKGTTKNLVREDVF